eukprot:PITA_21300
MSNMEIMEIKKKIQELLNKGIISHSTLPCVFPIVLVPKKDKTWHMCVDFCALNKITVKNHYPLPRIDDLLDQLSLTNAPTYFMRVMNDVLRPFLDDSVILYLDDILIFRKSKDEHVMHVNKLLDVLRKEQLFVKMSKCEFYKTYLVYLGHIVRGGELKIEPSKVEVILNWPKTNTITKLRRLLGETQYWRKFIANFSSIADPLHALTSVKKVFHWGDVQHKSFDALKQEISSAPVLALLDLRQPFEIQIDASDYAMGAILMQHKKPISFHSKFFNGVVTKNPTYDKELYVLVQSIKKWKHYLMGKETIIHTDHQPLHYLQSQSKLQQ